MKKINNLKIIQDLIQKIPLIMQLIKTIKNFKFKV